jgi:beta-phosphoglucomutase
VIFLFQLDIRTFDQHDIIKNGNRFMIGNGFFGYRGTLEEYSKDQMVALNLPGLYDQVPGKIRESVNAFNPLFTYLRIGNTILNPLKIPPVRHIQSLDMRLGIHRRETEFDWNGTKITIHSERFPGQTNLHLLAMRYGFSVSAPLDVDLLTGVDTAVHDLNGPHLSNISFREYNGAYTVLGETVEKKQKVAVSEVVHNDFSSECETLLIQGMAMRRFRVKAVPGTTYTITKYIGIDHTWADSEDRARNVALAASQQGWQELMDENEAFWKHKWNFSDVEIKGDDELQLAIRNSIYHLIIVRPYSEYRGIPSRGVSGQANKGSVTTDAELFLLPFYLNTDLDSARKLIMYRVHTLEGALRKAKFYGFRGAFYAWESQDTGDEACGDYNLIDSDTGVPIRTQFNQKMIHSSADVAMAIGQYVSQTNDHTVLAAGAFRVVIECARFYQSFVTFNQEDKRYEVKNVIGPDEYHEGVDNDAFTNRMILHTFQTMIKMIRWFRAADYFLANSIIEQYDYDSDIEAIKVIMKNLRQPLPREDGVIEQFDGYFALENVDVPKVKKRIKHPSEYWGGPEGVAAPTQVIRQADVALMLALFRHEYTSRVKTANWHYYEPKTDHYGSTFSRSMYAILACETKEVAYAREQLLREASIDLTGETKLYAGGVYVGGTHPATNACAYQIAVYGFAGLKHLETLLAGETRLTEDIQEMRFKCMEMGKIANVVVKPSGVRITWEKRQNVNAVLFDLDGVIVSTEHLHNAAWQKIAEREGIEFTPALAAKLRGLSRMEALDVILKGAGRKYSQSEKNNMAAFKNADYISSLETLSEKDILPNVAVTLAFLKSKKIKTAITSGSKSAMKVLEKTKLLNAFDAIVDGNEVTLVKPNPEVFLRAANKLGIPPENCVVVDDSLSGIQAAKAAGMFSASPSEAKESPLCDWKLKDLSELINYL